MGGKPTPGQIELLTEGNKLLELLFEDEEKADSWLKELLEARLNLFSLLLDVSAALRTEQFAVLGPDGSNSLRKTSS